MPPPCPPRAPASAGSARVALLVALVPALGLLTWLLLRPPPAPARPRPVADVADVVLPPARLADLGPLRSVPVDPSRTFDAKALDHVLRLVAGGLLVTEGDELAPGEIAAIPPAELPGREVETWGTVRELSAEAFASDVNPRWDQLWGFALDGDGGGSVVVVQPGEARALDGGKPAPTRLGSSLPPLKNGDRVRVRGVALQRRVGSIGTLSLDTPVPVVVGRQYRRFGNAKPAPATLAEVPWDTIKDRFEGDTRDFADDAHWALLAWQRRTGWRATVQRLVSGDLPFSSFGHAEFLRWRRDLEADTDALAPDPRHYTIGLRGKAFVLTGYLADVRVEDWDRIPENPYDVDRRYTYWLISDHYAHVGILFHCAFPISRFPGIATPAPGTKVRVRAFGLFVRNYTYAPKDGSPIATPAFQLLHLEADGR